MKKLFTLFVLAAFALTVGAQITTVSLDDNTLQQALDEDLVIYTDVTHLVVTDGTLTADDFTFIKSDMSTTLQILDMSGAIISGNTIPSHAFSDCSGLISVTIPNSVTSIDFGAFYNCTGLTAVTIPNSVTSIDGSVFLKCGALTSVTIPNLVASIGSRAFEDCNSLTSVAIPNLVTSIEEGTFLNCIGLISVTIPNSVTSIRAQAFSGCAGLASITIPNLVTSIGSQAFADCGSLTSVTIPASVTSIGANAFYGCTSLASIHAYNVLPVDLSISPDVFTDVNKSTCTLYVPAGSVAAYREAAQWGDFTNIQEIPATEIAITSTLEVAIRDASLTPSDITNMKIISGTMNPVDFEFIRNNMAATLQILDMSGATIVGNSIPVEAFNAYSVYSALNTVIIPASVTSIEGSAFSFCTSLTSVIIPASVTSIGGGAFSNCTGLTTIIIPNSVTSIGGEAFFNCISLTSVAIPASVTSIEGGAFAGCSSLTSIMADVGNLNYSSVDGVLFDKYQTQLVQCPGSKNGSYLIPTSVTSIGEAAFYNCAGLITITIPASVTSIGATAFKFCSGLTSIMTDVGNLNYSSVDGVLFDKNQTQLVQCPGGKNGSYLIPTSVASIGDNAFWGCAGLTSVTIPASATSIGLSAFRFCSGLTTITIPSSVTSIKGWAFDNCTSLTSITANHTLPVDLSASADVFRNVYKTTCTLHVPKGSVAAYQAAPQWGEFANIQEIVNWVMVVFDTQAGEEDAIMVEEGNLLAKPGDPVRAGRIFGGWYTEAACTHPWNFTTGKVTSDTTLYAQWRAAQVKLELQYEGAAPQSASLTSEGKIVRPANPARAGYGFAGWFREPNGTNAWNFETGIVTSDTTLYAKWSALQVTFNLQYEGSTLQAGTLTTDVKAARPTDPVRAGYEFGGWYTEPTCVTAWNFDAPVTADITLYARWTLLQTHIAGNIYQHPVIDGNPVPVEAGYVKTFLVGGGVLKQVDSVAFTAGSFTTRLLPFDKYIVSIHAEGYITGYYQAVAGKPLHARWEQADTISIVSINQNPVTGYLQKRPVLTGTFRITGFVNKDKEQTGLQSIAVNGLQASGTVHVNLPGTKSTMARPVSNTTVVLHGKSPVTSGQEKDNDSEYPYLFDETTPDSEDGQYEFNNLPRNEYLITIDIPGVEMGTPQVVNIPEDAAEGTSFDNVDFAVDEVNNTINAQITADPEPTHSVSPGLAKQIKAYPNPVVDRVRIVTGCEGTYTIRVFNTLGKMVTSTTSTQPEYELDMSSYPAGLYFVRIEAGGQTRTIKLTKN